MTMSSSFKHKTLNHTFITVIYLFLLVLVIPWYWPENDARQFYGFPFWALASLGVLFLTSVFTAMLCLQNAESACEKVG